MTRLIDADALMEEVDKIGANHMILSYVKGKITNAPAVQQRESLGTLRITKGEFYSYSYGLPNTVEGADKEKEGGIQIDTWMENLGAGTYQLYQAPQTIQREVDINKMVDNFLSWKLPSDFSPDGGISFKNDFNENTPWPMKHNPTGTNLFHAAQAKAMIEHMLAAAPTVQLVGEKLAQIDHGKNGLSSIIKTLEDLKGNEPETWLLIAPSGTVYKGTIQDIAPIVVQNHPAMRLNLPFTI